MRELQKVTEKSRDMEKLIYYLSKEVGMLVVKNQPANAGDVRGTGLILGLGRFPWRRAWQPTPAFSPGESH